MALRSDHSVKNAERSFRPRGRPLRTRWPATRTRPTLCCCQSRGDVSGCGWIDAIKIRLRQIRDARRHDPRRKRQRNAKNQRRHSHTALYRPGTRPSPRHIDVVRAQAQAGREGGRPPCPSMITLTSTAEPSTDDGSGTCGVSRLTPPRERCRVPKVQAALCPATMPYRRLIDDARRP